MRRGLKISTWEGKKHLPSRVRSARDGKKGQRGGEPRQGTTDTNYCTSTLYEATVIFRETVSHTAVVVPPRWCPSSNRWYTSLNDRTPHHDLGVARRRYSPYMWLSLALAIRCVDRNMKDRFKYVTMQKTKDRRR